MRTARTPVAAALVALLAGVAAGGAAAATPTTTRVSVSSTGAQADGNSFSATVSANGRYVAFASDATNLVTGDTNAVRDIFVRDLVTGTTRRVNLRPGGQQATVLARLPVMSANGQVVVFQSAATDLVTPATAGTQLFAWDRSTNAVRLVPPAPAPYGTPVDPSISDDGKRVAFRATVSTSDIFVADLTTNTVRRVTETDAGVAGNGDTIETPDISGNGRFVGFTTNATNLATPDTNGFRDVVVRDLESGAFTRASVVPPSGQTNLHSSTPALSADGCLVAFYSSATNLVTGVTTAGNRVYVRNRCAGDTELASLSNAAVAGTATVPIDISNDGCLVVFGATAILTPAPTVGSGAALRDRCAGTTSRLDVSTAGEPGTGDIGGIAISGGTGRYVVFRTGSAGLVPGDTNGLLDIFLRDRATNTAPTAALTLTQAGNRVTADATGSSDPDSGVITGSISFGDGSPAQSGLLVAYEYPRAGTYGVTVTVQDADGATAIKSLPVTVGPPLAPPPVDLVPIRAIAPPSAAPAPVIPPPLVLDRLGLSKRQFAAAGPRPGATGGAQLTLRLSDAALTTLRFERGQPGRRVKGRCVATGTTGARCTRFLAAGSLTRALKAGTSTVAVTGRIGRRSLTPGAYRLLVSARTADGRTAGPRALTFVVLPR